MNALTDILVKWNDEDYIISIPTNWPIDAVAEVAAFRIGLQPCGKFELVLFHGKVNQYILNHTE